MKLWNFWLTFVWTTLYAYFCHRCYKYRTIYYYHLRSEGGIIFSSVCLCVCLSVCLFFRSLFVCQHDDSWTVRDIITKCSGHHHMVERAGKFKNCYIAVRGWWFNVSGGLVQQWLIVRELIDCRMCSLQSVRYQSYAEVSVILQQRFRLSGHVDVVSNSQPQCRHKNTRMTRHVPRPARTWKQTHLHRLETNSLDLLTSPIAYHDVTIACFSCRKYTRTKQGRSDGGIYTLPKSGQVNFLWGNNDVRTVIEHFIPPKKLLYLPKTNFWLRPWPGNIHSETAKQYVISLAPGTKWAK